MTAGYPESGLAPLPLANMVEGGKTPLKGAQELQDIGYRLAIFPGGTVRAVAYALDACFMRLHDAGSNQGNAGRMLDFDALNGVLGPRRFLRARGATTARRLH